MFHAGKHVVARWRFTEPPSGIRDVEIALVQATERMAAHRVLRERGLMAVADESRSVTTANESAPMQRVEVLPPIQIRGLASDVSLLRRGISKIRELVADVHAARGGLEQDLADVRDQIVGHRRDIRFEAEQLGNGGEDEGKKE